VLALSLSLVLTSSISRLLDQTIRSSIGGDLLLVMPQAVALREVDRVLSSELPTVQSTSRTATYATSLQRIERVDGTSATFEQLLARNEAAAASELQALFETLSAQQLTSRLTTMPALQGRALTSADQGQRALMVIDGPLVRTLNLVPGDALILTFNGEALRFVILGIVDGSQLASGSSLIVPYDAVHADIRALSYELILEVPDDQLAATTQRLERTPYVSVIDVLTINGALQQLIRQFSLFPSVVAATSLIISAVVIANAVALGAIERRREIATLKALGLSRRRVLAMLLGESALLGLIGGSVGVGVALGTTVLILLGSTTSAEVLAQLGAVVPVDVALYLLALCVFIVLGAAFVGAWQAASERPLLVLRNS
jgi:putative ABC transport system permease protein